MSVIRVYHGKSNPYTVLSNEVLDDKNLSNGALGLWAKCMRRPNEWQFHVSEMIKNGKEGKSAIYRQIKELLDNGYCLRLTMRKDQNRKKMLFSSVDYVFFERKITQQDKIEFLKEFQKIYPHSDFLDADNRDPDNQPLVSTESKASTESSLESSISKEEVTSLKVPEEPAPNGDMSAKADEIDSAPPPKKIKTAPDPEIKHTAQAMMVAMREVKPDYKEPASIAAVETQIDLMLRRDGRKPQEVIDVFRWALSDPFWCDKMFKPNPAKYLREKFDQLHMKAKMPKSNAVREKGFAPSSDDKKAMETYKEFKKNSL